MTIAPSDGQLLGSRVDGETVFRPSEATEFYREHLGDMDLGSQVAWPARFNADELSALQHAMDLKLRDEESFFAEFQNEPLTTQVDEGVITPDQVAQKVNGRPRKEVPKEATHLTAFIDV